MVLIGEKRLKAQKLYSYDIDDAYHKGVSGSTPSKIHYLFSDYRDIMDNF